MRIRQIVFAARELAPNSAALSQLLALDPPYADSGVAEFGLQNAVYVFGDQFIEIIVPTRDGTTAGRLIERRGDSGYMLIVQTDDFDGDRARLEALGVRLVWNRDLPDIRAMHLHPKDIGGAIVSIDQPLPAPSWRWGGPWRMQPGAAAAQRVTGVSIAAHDPQAMAARWASVLALSAPQLQAGQQRRLALDGGHIDFVAADARGEGVAGFQLTVADLPRTLSTARAMALPVDGNQLTLMGTRLELLPL